MMRRLRVAAATSVFLCAGFAHAHGNARAQTADVPRAYWLIVSGLSGEDDIATSYAKWSAQISAAARDRFSAARVVQLSERGQDSAALSTRANIVAQLQRIGAEATATDELFIILIGHGSASDSTARIALPGPDLTARDLATSLQGVKARVTVVNTSSASGGWIAALAARGRVVITATKSGVEQNETTFGGYFAAALSTDDADTDKDNRVSVLEAYNYARGQVERAYAADKKMLTEHAQIDGDGDGKAVATAAVDSPDGAIAGLTFFGTLGSSGTRAGTAAVGPQSPELRALYAEKARLELQLSQLRARKAEMPDADYQKQLEALLLDIAKNGQSIRRLEGGK